MVRPSEGGGGYKIVPLNLDYDEYQEFADSLPRGKSVSKEIRQYIKARNAERKKIKNLNSPNYSAIATRGSIDIQSTLDKSFPYHIMDWETFKGIVNTLPEDDRIRLTEIWLQDFRILEMTNYNKSGKKVYPLI